MCVLSLPAIAFNKNLPGLTRQQSVVSLPVRGSHAKSVIQSGTDQANNTLPSRLFPSLPGCQFAPPNFGCRCWLRRGKMSNVFWHTQKSAFIYIAFSHAAPHSYSDSFIFTHSHSYSYFSARPIELIMAAKKSQRKICLIFLTDYRVLQLTA